MSTPRRPAGNSDEANFARFVHEKVTRQDSLGRVTGQKVFNTTQGKVIVPRAGSGSLSGQRVERFKLRFVEDDYLVCREWDGEDIGETDIYVALPHKLRCSLASESIYGDTHSYTYARDEDEPYMEHGDGGTWPGEESGDYGSGEDLYQRRLNTIRTVDDGSETEEQRVVPPWIKGDVIYAAPLDTPETTTTGLITVSGLPIDYVMVSDGRMWAKIVEE